MSFVAEFNKLPLDALVAWARQGGVRAARASLARHRPSLRDFASLISPGGAEILEEMCLRSQALTRNRFGRVIRLFAPLYLSNECVNNCKYCGFSRDNPILRVTLSVDEVRQEAEQLVRQGFRNILLVSGEHPKFVSNAYLRDCVSAVHQLTPSVSIEVGTLDTPEYRALVQAGADGLVVYQETYHRATYADLHTAGPKRDFDWRLETPERAYAAGFRRIGLGALYGLADWRGEALAVAAHAEYLLKHCWKAFLTLSIPRMRPAAGAFQPQFVLSDRELVQLVCAFRILFPDVGLVLSTREPARLRDGLLPLGITLISAGSHTEPGGYTGAGKDKLHRTERGRIVALAAEANGGSAGSRENSATGQFEIADERSAEEVASQVRRLGYEPVWKDWDAALTA
jgi:2-iminoacetate synthase